MRRSGKRCGPSRCSAASRRRVCACSSRPSRMSIGVGPISRRCPGVDYPIEHILPQKWADNWPVRGAEAEEFRAEHVHRLGNLTLLTKSLNSKVSNGPWASKREALRAHDTLLLNSRLLSTRRRHLGRGRHRRANRRHDRRAARDMAGPGRTRGHRRRSRRRSPRGGSRSSTSLMRGFWPRERR